MIKKLNFYHIIIICINILFANNVSAEELGGTVIKGSGATSIYPLLSKWENIYQGLSTTIVQYKPIGSGAGIKEIIAASVDFAASDKPLSNDDLKLNSLIQFPITVVGIVPIVNIPNVSQGELKLTGEILANIFMGKINKWNDPAILVLNQDLTLPDLPIIVTYRNDSSGTTFILSNYLSKVSSEWKDKMGNDLLLSWKRGTGINGSQDMAVYVSQHPGAIGYVEYSYALELNYVTLKNQFGAFIKPSHTSFTSALNSSVWKTVSDFNKTLTNDTGKESWPIVGTTYILIHKISDNAQKYVEMLSFFDWCYSQGRDIALKLKYVPINENISNLIRDQWKNEITDSNNYSVWSKS